MDYSPYPLAILVCLLFIFSDISSQVQVSANRDFATYQQGEGMNFEVSSNQSGTVSYSIYYDKKTPAIATGNITVSAGTNGSIPFSLNEPGVVICEVNQNGSTAIAGATFAPFELTLLESEPADFDAFWQNGKNQLTAVPLDPQLSLVQNNPYSKTYRISLGHIQDRRVYGYLTVPNGSGPFPGVVSLPPFGDSPAIIGKGIDLAEKGGILALSISIHNADPTLNQTDPNAYSPNSLDDPNQMYYRLAVLAGVRAVDYLFSRSDFDGQNVGLMGVSRGGGLAIMVAGIDNRVKLVLSSNPSHCQHLGIKYQKASGFPFYLNTGSSFQHQQSVKYFENISFAKRFKGAAWLFSSYEDLVCPAATTIAAFNQLNGPKILTHSIDIGHEHPAQYWNDRYAFFRRFFSGNLNPPHPNAPSNQGYFIDAGNDQNIPLGGSASLNATAALNGNLNPNWNLKWEKVNGPGTVNFSNSTSYSTTATFSQEGTYKIRFTAEDLTLIFSNKQYFTLMDVMQVTVGSCMDNDGDGTCQPADCDDNNASLPAPPGNPCNDNDSNTENDVIQADGCTCQGTPINNCTDNDGDQVCADQDCNDNDPSIPTTPGTPCNDGNAGTTNDMIQADGCTCEGTSSGGDPTICEVSYEIGPGSITVSGMDEPNTRLFIYTGNWSQLLFDCGWSDCNPSETISGLPPGTYVVKVQSYTSGWQSVCNILDYVQVTQDGGGCIDADNDDLCANEDCNDNDPNLPATPGSPCDDNNSNTENDEIQADGCTCAGTPIPCTDNDGDLVCQAEDCNDNDPAVPTAPGTPCDDGNGSTINDIIQSDGCTCQGCFDNDGDQLCGEEDCNDNDPSLPATPGTGCDDGNPATINDVIQSDGCTCQGTNPNAEPDCDNVQIDGSNGQLKISNLNAPIEIVRIRTDQWVEIFSCISDCDDPQIVPDLSPGLYRIQIQMYTASWGFICKKEATATVTQSSQSRNSLSDYGNSNIRLMPNPTRDNLKIFFSKPPQHGMQLFLYNQLGKQVFYKNYQSVNSQEKVDLSHFTNGIYILKIKTKNQPVWSKKVVVARMY